MPIICEDVENSPIIEKAAFTHGTKFIRAYSSPPPDTPLGKNWPFQPCILTAEYKKIATNIENFEVYPDDTWLITFPKCGTTWTQTIIWLLNNNLDYELESKSAIMSRCPFIEYSGIFLGGLDRLPNSVEVAKNAQRPRDIKSHLPADLLPKQLWTVKPKIIYVARNAKDVAISYYHHFRNLNGYKGSFHDFMDAFLADSILYQPFHQHQLDFWALRDEENILFLTYEDMKMDHLGVIKTIAKFLGKTHYSDEQLEKLRDHTTVDAMRSNDMVNLSIEIKHHQAAMGIKDVDSDFKFIRKGKTGTYLNEMSPELIKRFDDWSNSKLKNSDFKYPL